MSRVIFENKLYSVDIDIQIESHTKKKLDLTNIFTELEIIEDMTNFTHVGSIDITDTIGLKEFLPLIGLEKIKIRFRTGEGFSYWENDFVVIKLGSESPLTEARKHRKIKIYFASNELWNNYSRKYSISYKNIPISSIITNVFNNQLKYKKSLDLEETLDNINFVIPYLNPLTTISSLMKLAISKKTNDSGYFFYENKDEFCFKSLSNIYQTEILKDKQLLLDTLSTNEGKDLSGYIGLVNHFEVIKTLDIIEDSKKGSIGSTLLTFDYATKSFMKRTIDHEKYQNKYSWNIGKQTIYKNGTLNFEASVEEFKNYIVDRMIRTVDFQNSINFASKAKLNNRRIYSGISNNSIVVNKAGDSDLTCGKIINMECRSSDENTKYNNMLNGKFLIRSCRHIIGTSSGYSQVCLLTKDSYSRDTKNITKKINNKVRL
jgi:hypothetical protein